MSINVLPTPSSTAPIGNDDYTAQNGKIEGGLALSHEILTDWEGVSSAPDIAQGAYIYHSGNLYSVDGGDDPISGGVVDGINYIQATVVGTTLKCSFTTDVSGYSYNSAYNGMYNGLSKLLNAIVFVDGANNKRGLRLTSGCVDAWTLQDGETNAPKSVINEADIETADIETSTIETANINALAYGEIEYRVRAQGTIGINKTVRFHTFARGLYNFRFDALDTEIQIYAGNTWRALTYSNQSAGSFWSDGVNVRAYYSGTTNAEIHYSRA